MDYESYMTVFSSNLIFMGLNLKLIILNKFPNKFFVHPYGSPNFVGYFVLKYPVILFDSMYIVFTNNFDQIFFDHPIGSPIFSSDILVLEYLVNYNILI